MSKLYEMAVPNPAGYRDLDPTVMDKNHVGERLVDVREPNEFNGELGHIEGAELVPLATVEPASKYWNKDQAIVMICRSGGRSGRAAQFLASHGFSKVMNLAGGMIAHNAQGLPVMRDT